MLLRTTRLPGLLLRPTSCSRQFFSTTATATAKMTSNTPVEDLIREKVSRPSPEPTVPGTPKPPTSNQPTRIQSPIPRNPTQPTHTNGISREQLTTAFTPTTLLIRNDSHKHAHHAPMRDSTSKETHFHVTITSSSFASKPQPARHRMVYSLLKEEMSREGGIHALQLRTKTPEEEGRERERAAAQ
ncbi:BolA family protein [Aspergillus brunneoviolaceus CBS 621.78]|uniref:Bola-like protein n=1 Tax=Aspergillus brunneoviolaceus CBS 621.78 TaxID=1450534 RepID=A0ACD1GJ96_9EURO|nr:bola-like protein [Aspergillus brunneoviolaceus CBS 621.78]RAH49409.1 bola-like protein [Aspergillus brunneoviolaceus CBS 621.78]